MNIKNELKKMGEVDIWSLMLFILYKFQSIPEYSSLSELAYVLDKNNLLKLCEYFGGQTIKIPTIDQLENQLYAMLLYQYVDIEGMSLADGIQQCRVTPEKEKFLKLNYKHLKDVLCCYEFKHREM